MSRFNNLEFGDELAEPRQAAHKDEGFYLREANEAFEHGHFELALRAFAKVLGHNPHNAAAWAGQVRMLVELGEFREAKVWADKALEKFPDDGELLAAKAVALGRGGDLSAALLFSDHAVQARGDTPYVWLARGDVLLARREKLAEYCFDKAFALASCDWCVRWLAARIHAFHEQFARALKLAQEALALNTSQAVIWLELGRCQAALGLVGPAELSLAQARQLDPACAGVDAAAAQVASTSLWKRARGRWLLLFRR